MAGRYGLQIRAATATDAEGIAELMRGVDIVASPAAVVERLEAIRRSGCGGVLLAVEWGPPSGMLALHWHPAIGADMPLAHIDWLAVALEERRRGIARTLLKSASQLARSAGCGSLTLAVPDQDDGTLRAFCGASGLEPSGAAFARSLRKARSEA